MKTTKEDFEYFKSQCKVWREKIKEFEKHVDCPIHNYTYENGVEAKTNFTEKNIKCISIP